MELEARYEFLDKIGSGSYATVYRARDNELGREVAIKQIHDQYLEDPKQLDRYWQEAQLLASLAHPNIVTIFDIYRERGWLILELMQANLADRMEGRQMSLTSLRTTIAHALRALKYLHARGIIHGDIKPSNLMIDSRRRIKIGDFGLARRVSDEEGSLLKGATKYMAPEVLSDEFGEVGPASDLYSLGFCAYELMCGSNFEDLFPGLTAHARNMQAAWMMWHAAPDRRLPEIPKVLEGVPDDLAQVIQKLCQKDQSQRYASAQQALSDLNIDVKPVKTDGASGETASASSSRDPGEEIQEQPAADRKRLWVAAAAMAVSVVLSLFILFSGNGDTQPAESEVTVGVVDRVFPEEGRIIILGIDQPGAEEVRLGSRPVIYSLNQQKHIVLRDLRPGDRVELQEKSGQEGKKRFELTVARPVESEGRLQSVQAAGTERRVVVSIDDGNRHEVLSLRVPPSAEILLNGDEELPSGSKVELIHLKVGDEVTVTHFAELGRRTGRLLTSLRVRREQAKTGYVAGVEPDRDQWGTLTVRFGRGETAGMMTRPVAKDCKITLEASPGSPPEEALLADLQPGDYVSFSYDEAIREIAAVRRKLTIEGTVDELGLGKARMTITDSQTGRPVAFQITPNTKISLSQQPASFSDLRSYDAVIVDYEAVSSGRYRAVAVSARRPVKYDRWAVIVGIESYEDPSLSPISYSADNAAEIRRALVDRYAFDPKRILLLTDATGDELRAKVSAFLTRAGSRDAQLMIYFCGHGYVAGDNTVYLAPRNFRLDDMAMAGIRLDWLMGELENCASRRKTLFLDCTHGGDGKDLERQPSTAEMVRRLDSRPKQAAVIASCDQDERGLVRDEDQLGLFAWALAEGYRGAADADRNLVITAGEIATYLESAVADYANRHGLKQTPVAFVSGPSDR